MIVVNFIFYVYFNLEGYVESFVFDYCLCVCVECFILFDENQVLMGEFVVVVEMFFDFCCSKYLGWDIDVDDEQIYCGSGFDYNWVFDGWGEDDFVLQLVV